MTRFVLRLLALAALATALTASPALAGHRTAKADPNQGIVDIYTTLGYQQSQAAGTGIVVTANGEVLTNNHVIRGATRLSAVDVTTGRRYTARVVGYDVADDVAVLRLVGAAHLRTVALGNSAVLRTGAAVRAIGNAQGRGGKPSVAAGKVTGLHRSIVASDDQGGSETLTNLIATNAAVEPGDSGGPLVNAAGRVVGIVTAGSTGFAFQASATRGFAIPINKVRAIAKQIVAGHASPRLHVGPTAFLGVSLDSRASGGAGVYDVVPGSAAEAAGLQGGDVITSLDGKPVASQSDLQGVVLALKPGQAVAIEWTDRLGTAQTGTITPASGPPQ
ncbi:MAG TPA: trypsin-like peptidase domain-containing protein [Gaiellaceae bacterium]|nr:trypsin-like peptidase domain-containing protein [Gaiellaceae bacterium]